MPRVFNKSKGQIRITGVKGLPPLVLQAGQSYIFKNDAEYHRYMKKLNYFKSLIDLDLTPVTPESIAAQNAVNAAALKATEEPLRKKPGPKPKQENEGKEKQQDQNDIEEKAKLEAGQQESGNSGSQL